MNIEVSLRFIKKSIFIVAFAGLVSCLSIFATQDPDLNQVCLGPEVYSVLRTKEGGAEQKGVLWGGRARYERLKGCKWYLGAEISYARGDLTGRSGSEDRIKSTLSDGSIEGRLGYSFLLNERRCFTFTPFIGIGYFCEKNNFCCPSPIPVHFRNSFSYLPLGFLSYISLSDRLKLGLRFTARYLWDHKMKVTHDPHFGKLSLKYVEKCQYRIEMPLLYEACLCNRVWLMGISPFFEYRRYGHLANFPFDFLETKFRLWGAYLQLIYLF